MAFSIHRSHNLALDLGRGYFEPSSTLDWCERNYKISYFYAEFYNSTSSLNYVLLAILGIMNSFKIKAERRDYVVFIGAVLAIGIGSCLFHQTLIYQFQLADELPMLFGTATLLFSQINLTNTESFSKLSIVVLMMYTTMIAYIYDQTRIPEIFQVAYGLMALLSALIPIHHISILSKIYPHLSKVLTTGYLWSVGSYILGFAFWIFENNYCDELRSFRESLPYFIQPLFEFHALWHILTGIGGYGGAVFCQYCRKLVKKGEVVELRYLLRIWPVLVERKVKKS